MLLEGGTTLKRRRVNVEMGGGGLPLFYYFNVQLHLVCVAGTSNVSFITFWFLTLFS